MRYDVLIVGAGHGGAQAAIALHQGGFTGSVAIVGDEPELPYERPPLSKDYLARNKPFERLLIRPATFWAERKVDMLTGRLVTAVDPAGKTVTTSDGRTIGYGSLIWAAGGSPRRLSCQGHDLSGVHGVRTRADVDQLMGELDAATKVVVVGGGYIGLEAAAVLAKLGKQVTVLEAMDRVLARVAAEPVSRFYEDQHRAHGVDVRLNVAVDHLEGEDKVTGVRLADGTLLPADIVIVGIGIIPAIQPLADAGAICSNGVDVDEYCRTSLTDVYAIGDCAAHENAFAEGRRIRLESVQNANDQATTAAKAILGVPAPYHAVPWFWSNQYDLKLQTVGLSTGFDDSVVRGDPASGSFSLVYLRARRVIALDCINSVKDYVQGRGLVLGGVVADRGLLADPATPLKSLG